MSHRDASLAWEGDKDPKHEPGQFLREIEAQINKDGLLTDKQMISRFKVNLRYGFQADLWFADLNKAEKDTYDHLVAAFEKQWPLTKQPKASKAERVHILKECVMNLLIPIILLSFPFPFPFSFSFGTNRASCSNRTLNPAYSHS